MSRALAISLACAAGCGAGAEPASPPRAGACPSATSAPIASVIASATPSAAATAAPIVSATAQAQAPAAPQPYKLLWYTIAPQGGNVLLRPHAAGIAVIPVFLGSTVEGSTVAVLDAAGLAKRERSFGGVGAATAAVAPDGSITAIAVDSLNWPKTQEAYEQRRILTIAAGGKSASSFKLPEGLSADGLRIDDKKSLLLTGQYTGKQKLGPGVLLQDPVASAHAKGESAKPRGFVASYSPDGHARWARVFEGTVSAWPGPDGKVLFLQTPDEDGMGPAQKLLLGDGTGHDDWKVDIAADCAIRSLEPQAGAGILAVAPTDCFTGAPRPPNAGGRCAAYRFDPATGKKTSSFDLPACYAAADSAGVATLNDDNQLSLLDASGKQLWSTPLVIPMGCLFQGFEITGLTLDASSIYVAGACLGSRIGTMFNSPYARASDRSMTYLARYDRR